jgi:DNA modification methylase
MGSMTLSYQDDWLTLYTGDNRAVMQEMPEKSVHTCVTSPPYFGLRDYGLPPQIWGGKPDHDHIWGEMGRPFHPGQVEQTKWKNADAAGKGGVAGTGRFCDCGAWLGTLGNEPTPDLYIDHLVEVFRGVWRVLRDDGTLWLNLGDSFSSSSGRGMKPKDLIGIPWLAAFALREDGWYLRSDIVWNKPNAMPESVEDRPTRSHEFIFLLTKQPKYYYDHVAIKEPVGEAMLKAANRHAVAYEGQYRHDEDSRMGKTSPNRVWSDPEAVSRILEGRNKRDVWTVPTKPSAKVYVASGDESGTLSPDCPVHSLRAIRRNRQMAADDELLGLAEYRNQRRSGGRVQAPVSGQLSSFHLESTSDHLATQDFPTLENLQSPMPENDLSNRTPYQPNSDDGLGGVSQNDGRTNHTQVAPTSLYVVSSAGVSSAIRNNAPPSKSNVPLEIENSASALQRTHTSRTVEQSDDDEHVQHISESNISEDYAEDDRLDQISSRTSGICTCKDNSIAHFAVFPEELVRPMILAGTSGEGVCATCGDPWARSYERVETGYDGSKYGERAVAATGGAISGGTEHSTLGSSNGTMTAKTRTVGWKPTCAHEGDAVPATVCDPFGGSGTIGQVSSSLGRKSVLIDLSDEYLQQQHARNRQVSLGLGV